MDTQEKVDILLVEDNPDHAELTIRTLRKGKLANSVLWVRDGIEAMDLLYRRNAYADHAGKPLPGLVLLDVNLPKCSGLEVLSEIKGDPTLRVIPVVMLTTSGREEEVRRSFELGANSFVTKPVRFDEFSEKIQQIEQYWFLINRLSTRPRA
ncbi:MAG: response regulator [Nitrospirota bacterium]